MWVQLHCIWHEYDSKGSKIKSEQHPVFVNYRLYKNSALIILKDSNWSAIQIDINVVTHLN